MAARIKLRHTPDVREKIRTSQLVNRLQNCALGKVNIKADSLKAIEILLRKTIPDLKAVEHSGVITNQVSKITVEIIESDIQNAKNIQASA